MILARDVLVVLYIILYCRNDYHIQCSCVTALLRIRDELSAAIANDVLRLIAAVLLRNK